MRAEAAGGHVITPVNKKGKELAAETSFQDFLPATQQQPQTQGRQIRASQPKPGGQPVRKLNVPKAAERPQQSDAASDLLNDLLPGLNLGPDTVRSSASNKICKLYESFARLFMQACRS